jgi:predicted nucleic acid-binding Zn ribbon protein
MPTYQFLNTETGEEFETLMKISEREDYLKTNPHIQPIISAPALVSGVSTSNSRTGRVPSGFNEVLSKVSEAHPTSPVAQRYGKKSIKQIKTEQIVKKHLG